MLGVKAAAVCGPQLCALDQILATGALVEPPRLPAFTARR